MFPQVTEDCPSNCKGMYTVFIMFPYIDLFDKCTLHVYIYTTIVYSITNLLTFTYYTFKNPLSYAHLNKHYDLFTSSALINTLLFCFNILINSANTHFNFQFIYIHVHMHTYMVSFHYSIFLYTLAKEKKILFCFPINTA